MEILFTLLEGFGLGAGLIIAIGAQNAFVLRQGLKRDRVLVTALFCAFADLGLILAGVFGLGVLLEGQAWFLTLITWGGAAFLGWYGVKAGVRAFHDESLNSADSADTLSWGRLLATLAAFTFLNPHVYLDTVLLLGGLGARHTEAIRPWFTLGAAVASFVWFFGLAYGARFLAPWFRRPITWRILDAVIALIMLGLAASLIFGALR